MRVLKRMLNDHKFVWVAVAVCGLWSIPVTMAYFSETLQDDPNAAIGELPQVAIEEDGTSATDDNGKDGGSTKGSQEGPIYSWWPTSWGGWLLIIVMVGSVVIFLVIAPFLLLAIFTRPL